MASSSIVLLTCSPLLVAFISLFFFFNATATTSIYTLSLHDALPIFCPETSFTAAVLFSRGSGATPMKSGILGYRKRRSEEHTSELQSLRHLVCRLLLEKKKSG